MKTFTVIGTLALIGGFALGDTILENGGSPAFTNVPANFATGLGTGTPYWDDRSGDFGGSNSGNVGDFLTATGNFAGGTNYNPSQYLSGPGSGGADDAPAAFNLVHTTNSLIISLIGANTGSISDVFGIYNASAATTAAAVATEIPLFGPSLNVGSQQNESAAGFSNIGFYITDSFGVEWFSNAALNSNGTSSGDVAGHQHFVLFTTGSSPNVFYLGVEDWVSNSGESLNGDYNDILLKIDATPEPATFTLMGVGLLGLAFARFRSRSRLLRYTISNGNDVPPPTAVRFGRVRFGLGPR